MIVFTADEKSSVRFGPIIKSKPKKKRFLRTCVGDYCMLKRFRVDGGSVESGQRIEAKVCFPLASEKDAFQGEFYIISYRNYPTINRADVKLASMGLIQEVAP
jgi:hypothetical protein